MPLRTYKVIKIIEKGSSKTAPTSKYHNSNATTEQELKNDKENGSYAVVSSTELTRGTKESIVQQAMRDITLPEDQVKEKIARYEENIRNAGSSHYPAYTINFNQFSLNALVALYTKKYPEKKDTLNTFLLEQMKQDDDIQGGCCGLFTSFKR